MAKFKFYITEEEYKQIVRDSVANVLKEYAEPLKKYTRNVEHIRFRLAENWCLCKYCQMYSSNNVNFSHWETELQACIKFIKLTDIKNGIDKRKTLIRVLVQQFDFDSPNMIRSIIADKFKKEDIRDEKIISIVAQEMVNDIFNLIDVIAYKENSIAEYFERTFHS